MNRLLVVACSQRKSQAKGVLPAIERYDGPVFRVLRKYLREGGEDTPCVFILSAKFGLIAADVAIPDYDCRLTPASALKLRPQVLETAGRLLQSQRFRTVGICAGKDYRMALDGLAAIVPQGVQIEFVEGGQGPRLAALKKWLRGEE